MQRRTILLFILFLVMAWYYSVVVRQAVPAIVAKQSAQTKMLNELDSPEH